jgi:hypothetical protein
MPQRLIRNRKPAITTGKLLRDILQPHTELAVDLLRLVRRRKIASSMTVSTADPSHRFQIAALIVFLAGIDKSLSLALQLLYLAGAVNWNWLKGRGNPEPGELICYPGFSAKMRKLEQLGFDFSFPNWLVELRNSYIHECSLYAGYGIVFAGEESLVQLRASGPVITGSSPPVTPLRPIHIKAYSRAYLKTLSRFLNKFGCTKKLITFHNHIQKLPINPEPEYSNFRENMKDYTVDDCSDMVFRLNHQYVGEGFKLLGSDPKKDS